MSTVPREVSGFVALPVTLRTKAFQSDVQHYVYIRPHEPQIPEENADRALFLVNIPVMTTDTHLRHLFATQLQAGRVEHVCFSDRQYHPSSASSSSTVKDKNVLVRSNRKRKRVTAEEIEAGLDSFSLPDTSAGHIHKSGSSAVVIFVDRASAQLSLQAARKATKRKTNSEIVWGEGTSGREDGSLGVGKVGGAGNGKGAENVELNGLRRYEAQNTLRFPDPTRLMRLVDGYMAAYTNLEEARAQEVAQKRAMPDEDGFITVTRGSRGAVRADDAKELGEQMKAKEKEKQTGLVDFYRFQMREKRKEQENETLRKFEEDKRRIEEMRARRGKPRPEG